MFEILLRCLLNSFYFIGSLVTLLSLFKSNSCNFTNSEKTANSTEQNFRKEYTDKMPEKRDASDCAVSS